MRTWMTLINRCIYHAFVHLHIWLVANLCFLFLSAIITKLLQFHGPTTL